MLDLLGPFSAPMTRIGIRERDRPKGIRVEAGQPAPLRDCPSSGRFRRAGFPFERRRRRLGLSSSCRIASARELFHDAHAVASHGDEAGSVVRTSESVGHPAVCFHKEGRKFPGRAPGPQRPAGLWEAGPEGAQAGRCDGGCALVPRDAAGRRAPERGSRGGRAAPRRPLQLCPRSGC